MTFETYLVYLATVLIFFAHPPGPSQVLFMAGSMQHGLRRALPILAGDLTANTGQILIAGFGLAGLVAISANVFTAVKWAGIVYLVYVGLRMIRQASRAKDKPAAPKRAALFRTGFVTSAANPYAVIFFAALFPQFIDPAAPVAPQVAILGITYLVIDGIILVLMGATAARLFALMGARIERWVGVISGAGLILAAALLALRGDPEPAK
ncbi:LysE family translocator [Thalassococcus sp. S3]|uniref:LysE family translocator n=1 Tax=Thalassococcus sp. S3 TaxID=2017482 RepID=UPI00102475B2|nr:LysE family transporter [Thalassococcus sp. S3]QBF33106.1 lysine transporter LysE [Thalassococcus sp. S3]